MIFVHKYRLLKTHDYFFLSLIFNFCFSVLNFIHFIHLSNRQSKPVWIVNIVGIPTCSQHLLTWFANRPDDGHVRTETCSLTHNKAWCVWWQIFIILLLNFSTSGCLQSNRNICIFIVYTSLHADMYTKFQHIEHYIT